MEADTILFTNANVLSMDPELPRAEAILVRDGRIAAVGDRAEVERQARGARQMDLDGRTVIPGFNDCHCHILSFGLDLERVDVSSDVAQSIEDIVRIVARRAEQAGADQWILGRGYDQNGLAERRHPTRHDLDRAGAGRPVVLWHTSGHVLAASSRALQRAGISTDTPTPRGGEIERDEHGAPTGVLKEAPAMNLVSRAIPPPTVEQGTEAIIQGMQVMARQGITSASDAATGRDDSIDPELEMYRRALASGHLAGRITLMPQIFHVAPPDSERVVPIDQFDVGDQPEMLQIGATKIFSDGALSTRTAAVRQPYLNTDDTGILIWDPATLADMIDRANRAGWQIATHALGDRAIEVVLDCYQQALSRTPRPDHRHRIEHCMMADEGLAQKMRDLTVITCLQPDIFRLGDGYIAALGMERAAEVIPLATFERFKLPIAFSSDRPVIPGDPLQCVLDAMLRKTPQGVTLGPGHRIAAERAIRYYTTGAARAIHAEDGRGMIRRGMLADLAVLSQDPTVTEAERFDKVTVTMTVVGGRIVFEA